MPEMQHQTPETQHQTQETQPQAHQTQETQHQAQDNQTHQTQEILAASKISQRISHTLITQGAPDHQLNINIYVGKSKILILYEFISNGIRLLLNLSF